MRRTPRPVARYVAVAVLVAVLVGSVTAATATAVPRGATTARAATQGTAGNVPLFTGTVDEFYVVPRPLPYGRPGKLIRVQPVSSDTASTTVRIMYHSRDAQGRDRAVTGMLTYPNARPPKGGWPVVSWANGTVGMAAPCALSRRDHTVSTAGIAGVGVQSDYVGLGPVGELHPYLSRPSEAFSVIDAVRAARNLPGSGAGRRWVAIGGSQGGHGALSANELGESYAPELRLLGSVALAPAAMFGNTYGGVDVFATRVVGSMALYGAATEHPEIDPNDYVTPAAATVTEHAIRTGCLTEITNAVLSVPFDEFYAHDPAVTEPARSIAAANDVGNVAVDTPVFLVQGTADTIVFPQRTRDLFARMCGHGQTTEFLEVPGADHGDVGSRAATEVHQWIADRFARLPATNSCPPSPEPTVLPGAASAHERDRHHTTIDVPVRLSAPPTQVTTAKWRTIVVPGLTVAQARPGHDYAPAHGVVRFAPGSTRATVRVDVFGDRRHEPDELIVLAFDHPTNGRIGGFWGLGFATVVDDD